MVRGMTTGPRLRTIPPGDHRERLTCPECGFIAYENPKVIVGAVATAADGRILLCRRAIEPRLGYWTLPAGFMEMGETAEEGAAREALEEANARLAIEGLIGVYSIARIGQVHLYYRARLLDPAAIRPTPESSEVALVAWDDIPWQDLAFRSVAWALKTWRQASPAPLSAAVPE